MNPLEIIMNKKRKRNKMEKKKKKKRKIFNLFLGRLTSNTIVIKIKVDLKVEALGDKKQRDWCT